MTKSELIAGRLREVLLNGHWIANTNYREQLLDVSLEMAIHKVGKLNSIAALTYHINYYLDGLLKVLNGGPLDISDTYSFDLPPITTETNWQQLVTRFLNNGDLFCKAVAQLTDAQLEAPFVEEKYGTYLRNIEAVIEHSYYHMGQIVIIKKLISTG